MRKDNDLSKMRQHENLEMGQEVEKRREEKNENVKKRNERVEENAKEREVGRKEEDKKLKCKI